MTAVFVIGTFCGCAASEEKAAKEAADNGMKQLQKADLDKASDYIGGLEGAEKNLKKYEKEGIDSDKLVKAIFGNMEYEIKDAEMKDDDTVDIKMEVTNVDMKKAASAWADAVRKDIRRSDSKLVKAYMESGGSDYKALYKAVFNMLVDKIDTEDSTTTQNITVNAKKSGGSYKLDFTEKQVNKIAGNLEDAFDDVRSGFSL